VLTVYRGNKLSLVNRMKTDPSDGNERSESPTLAASIYILKRGDVKGVISNMIPKYSTDFQLTIAC